MSADSIGLPVVLMDEVLKLFAHLFFGVRDTEEQEKSKKND